jgi:CRISPR/Cas system CSM-associated protein Csm5 (group 7 of RAMP superfamily)
MSSIERDKQVTDQQKKHAAEKERRKQSRKDVKARSGQQHAGMATDHQTMRDKDYVERIEDKTEKH